MSKIGLIQVRGLGDCIIILPIAQWLHSQGHDVYIALDSRYCEQFQYAAPYCTFVPVPFDIFDPTKGIHNEYWYEYPHKLLQERGCDTIISFPQHESILLERHPHLQASLGHRVAGPYERRAYESKAVRHLKFDEYKYFVANMPLRLKWTLALQRNPEREQALYDKLVDPTRKQLVCHLDGSNFSINPETLNVDASVYQVIQITPDQTNNIFDWLLILERADTLLMIDSVFFNIVEQLNLPNRKYFVRRSPRESTPVIGNQWGFVAVDVPDENTLFG